MASGDVTFRPLAQSTLGTAVATLIQVTTGRTGLHLLATVCNFAGSGVGYDLKLRPAAEGTANKHFIRAGRTSGNNLLKSGATELWDIPIRPESAIVLEGSCQSADSVAVTISLAEQAES